MTTDISADVTGAAMGISLYDQCRDFLVQEAEYLDERRFREWLTCLAPDLEYRIPIRVTCQGQVYEEEFSTEGFLMRDTFASMSMRVERLYTANAFAEDPPSRTMRMVSNIRAVPAGDDEAQVRSNFLCYRSTGDRIEYDLLAGQRRDVLRHVDGRWLLARRTVLLAHTTVPTANLGLFL